MTIPNEVLYFLSGSTALAVIAHAVNTFPTPENEYGRWLLGIAKFIVGQRLSGVNAILGLQTEVTAVTNEQKEALKNGSSMQIIKTDGPKPVPPQAVTPKT